MRVRHSARVILLDSEQRVLLFQYRDATPLNPLQPVTEYWATVGGEVEKDETFEQAARREVVEETGICDFALGSCVARRDVELRVGPNRELVHCKERYFLGHAFASKCDIGDQLPEVTNEICQAGRWWSLDEIRSSDCTFFPEGLVEILDSCVGARD